MISILMPSRGRPEHVKKVLGSICDTMSKKIVIEVIVRVDNDDPSDYSAILGKEFYNARPCIIRNDPTYPNMSCLWNEAFTVCSGDIIQMGADDIFYHTKDWDLMVNNEFEIQKDKILLVWGKDGGHNERLSTHGFVSRQWIETVGYFTPPYALVYGNDDWVFLIARELGRQKYLPDVFIEHQRPGRGSERLRQFKQLSTDQVYSEWGRLLRQQAVNRLRVVMED
jgi:hypothetical protein